MKPRRRGTEAQRREDTQHRQPLKKTEIPRFNEVEKISALLKTSIFAPHFLVTARPTRSASTDVQVSLLSFNQCFLFCISSFHVSSLSNDFGTVWLHLIATLLCFHSSYARLTFPDPQCEVQRQSDGYSSFSCPAYYR